MQEAAVIETNYWRVSVPPTPRRRRKVCVPTVHPIGDQRVLRTSQAAIDAGYDVHFIWLGGEPGRSTHSDRITETRLAAAKSFGDRLRQIVIVTKEAWVADADIWHIHDFYMLPSAYIWCAVKKRAAIYDVHEYYPEYYSERLPVPVWLRACVARSIIWMERKASARLGAVNAVSENLSARLRGDRVHAISTPNFPAQQNFRGVARPLTPNLLTRVIHTGMLTKEYGSELLIDLARELIKRAPQCELLVIRRFPSRVAEVEFDQAFASRNAPSNLRMLDPMPIHRLTDLLSTCGIGLSALQNVGQLAFGVPTKLYEYAVGGLAIVSSNLPASRDFCERNAVAFLAHPDEPSSFANQIVRILGEADLVCGDVNAMTPVAREALSWERHCGQRVSELLEIIESSHGARA